MNTLRLFLFLATTIIPVSLYSAPFETVREKHLSDLEATYVLISDARLPEDVTPTRYRLELIPNLEQGTFRGNVKINLNFKKYTDKISLHAHSDLGVEESTIKLWKHQKPFEKGGQTPDVKKVGIERVVRQLEDAIIVIYSKQSIKQGEKCELEINFNGYISNITQGLFKGSYQEISGETFYWATNLRPTNTRRLFPCFDEPAIKAPFTVNIHRPKGFSTLFNTECKYTEKLNDAIEIDHFEATNPMSTFSLGFVISQLTLEDNQAPSKIGSKKPSLRIWGRSTIHQQLQDISAKFVKVYDQLTQYFGADIPLSKIDIIAIPGVQAKVPINNWGLIVYEETDLLYYGYYYYYALIQELIFQWFGSWVTPYWWIDDIFNNGLTDFLIPYTILEVSNGLELCGVYPAAYYYVFYNMEPTKIIKGIIMKNSRKVEFVLRMLNYTLGTETLKKGVQNLIAERKYGTYNAENVWNALTNQAHKDKTLSKDVTVNEIAELWITNDSFPALSVERNYQLKTAKITQRIFLRRKSDDAPEQDKSLWWIPLVINTQDNMDFTNSTPHSWMNEIREVTIKGLPDEDKFIIVNPEEIGPFLVNYDELNWNLLAEYLQTESGRKQIPPVTRVKLIHDAFSLAISGNVSFATVFNMTLFVRFDNDVVVLQSFLFIYHSILGKIKTQTPTFRKKFSKYIIIILAPLYKEQDPSHRVLEEDWKFILQDNINRALCRATYRPCIEEAQASFKKWMQSENPDAENPVPHLSWSVLKWSTVKEWEFLLDRFINSPIQNQDNRRDILLNYLVCFSAREVFERLLKMALVEANGNFSEENISRILHNRHKILFHILSDNWDLIKDRFENNTKLWDKMINSATSYFKTQEEYSMLSKFYEQRRGEFGSAEGIIQKKLTQCKEIKEVYTENLLDLSDMEKWLDNFLSTSNATNIDSLMMDDDNGLLLY